MSDSTTDTDKLDIPKFLKREPGSKQPANEVTTMPAMQSVEAEMPRPRRASKANGKAPVKAKGRATKAAKGAKVAKAKATGRKVDEFGFTQGSKKSKAAAMYASKRGATLGEVKDKMGTIMLNLLIELEGKGHKVKRVKEKGDGNRQVTRYFLS